MYFPLALLTQFQMGCSITATFDCIVLVVMHFVIIQIIHVSTLDLELVIMAQAHGLFKLLFTTEGKL